MKKQYSRQNPPTIVTDMIQHLFDGDEANAYERMADIFDGMIDNANRLDEALRAFDDVGYGLTFKMERGDRWVCILQDMSDPSKSRWQSFDRVGFIGHGEHATAAEAIKAAVQMGASNVVDGSILDQLAVSEEWLKNVGRF